MIIVINIIIIIIHIQLNPTLFSLHSQNRASPTPSVSLRGRLSKTQRFSSLRAPLEGTAARGQGKGGGEPSTCE